jgi:hypothetical protein
VYLHKEVIGALKNQIVDHKDRNKLNSCKSNLRIALPHQNCANASFRKVKKYTKYTGVFKILSYKKMRWMANLTVNYKKIHLGSFPLTPCGELLAAIKYDEAAIKYRGEFANLNFPNLP